MQYKVTVSPKDKTPNGWFIYYFRWISYDSPAPDMHLLQGWVEADGKYSATIDVPDGDYGLHCHAALSGREVEIDLSPRPAIVWPKNKQWPFKVKVPSTRSQHDDVRYFRVGAGQ